MHGQTKINQVRLDGETSIEKDGLIQDRLMDRPDRMRNGYRTDKKTDKVTQKRMDGPGA